MRWRLGLAVALCSLGLHAADNITGAGATFPYPVYAKWAAEYKAKTGVGMNYQSIGSGGGVKQILAKTVDFGASDDPMKPEELEKNGLLQWPMVVGGVVPVVNVPGIKPGQMRLTGEVLADIFLKKITKWNDPAIAALNPDLPLPDRNITVIHRADGSGTSFLFTDYLSRISPEWKKKVGSGKAVKWPAGLGGKGNEGVGNYVKRVPGAIGYVEYAYAYENQMTHTQIKNQAGKFVSPSLESFAAAAENADWKNAPGFYLVLNDQPGEKSWPNVGATFILMHKAQEKQDRAKACLDFFDWAFREGSDTARKLQYVPLPESVTALVRQTWKEMKDTSGAPVWTGAGN